MADWYPQLNKLYKNESFVPHLYPVNVEQWFEWWLFKPWLWDHGSRDRAQGLKL